MSRTLFPFLSLLLAGCPFVFGPPDYSNVGGNDDSADTDTVTDTSDTDTTTNGSAPLLLSFDLGTNGVDLVAEFTVSDAEPDLLGGQIHMTDKDQVTTSFSIPGALPELDWDQFGTSTLLLPLPPGCEPIDESWTMVIEDLATNQSEPLDSTFVKSGLGTIAEPLAEPEALGAIDLPASWCSTATDVADADRFEFTPNQSGAFEIRMIWGDLNDIDVYIYQCDAIADPVTPCSPAVRIDLCPYCGYTSYNPEVMLATFVAGELYQVHVEPFDLAQGPSDYTIDINPQ